MINEKINTNRITFKIQKKGLFNTPQISTNRNTFNMVSLQSGPKIKSSNRLRDKYNDVNNEEDMRQSFNSEKSKLDVKKKPTLGIINLY